MRSRAPSTSLDARASVAVACVLTFALHLLFLSRELTPDEGGFAMVARHWRQPGPYLYGTQWVDRPPGLMVVFEVSQALGPMGVRLMAGVFATVLVAAAAWAAGVVGGLRAATWSAWTAFALATSPFLLAYQLNGEIIAAPLVMLSAAAALHTLYRRPTPRRTVVLATASGLAGAAAILVKQDFADGLVFVAVLQASAVLLRRPQPRGTLLAALGSVAGAGSLLGATAWWAASRAGGVPALAYAMYGFRADADDFIAQHSWHAPETRLVQLLGLAIASGMVLVAGQLLVSQWRELLRPSPLVWAVSGALSVELAGVMLGASYWPHYLIGLIPMLALSAGLAVAGTSHRPAPPRVRAVFEGRRGTRLVVVIAVLTTTVTAPLTAVSVHRYRSQAYRVGSWLTAAAQATDTVVVPYTHANVIEASGLTSPYPYAWSLPLRTLDPGLVVLTRTLSRPRLAPTWVVRWDTPHAWGLDPRDHLVHALESHYRLVAVVCGHQVWLHRGVHRAIPAPPQECGPSPSAPLSVNRSTASRR